MVDAEIAWGDPSAAKERIAAVEGLPRLAVDDASRALARDYVRLLRLPAAAAPDALHLALTVANEIEYLLTWNCRHLANPRVMRAVAIENASKGLFVPLIVTPQDLLEMEAMP